MKKREIITNLVQEGLTSKQISEKLGLSLHTIRYYRENRGKAQSSKISQHRMRLKCKSLDYSGNKCIKCDYDSCVNNMIFHHIDPQKKECKIASGDTRSWDHLKKELDKTVLLCCRCHGELHAHLWCLDDIIINKQVEIRIIYVDKPLAFYKDDIKPNSDFCNNRYKHFEA